MVVLHPRTEDPKPHFLVARKDIDGFASGEIKECYIQKMTDNRFEVFARSYKDYTHVVIPNEKELHETFNEQTSIQ